MTEKVYVAFCDWVDTAVGVFRTVGGAKTALEGMASDCSGCRLPCEANHSQLEWLSAGSIIYSTNNSSFWIEEVELGS